MSNSNFPDKQILDALDHLESVMFLLSEWEQNFIGDISEKFDNGYSLSDNQRQKVMDIYNRTM